MINTVIRKCIIMRFEIHDLLLKTSILLLFLSGTIYVLDMFGSRYQQIFVILSFSLLFCIILMKKIKISFHQKFILKSIDAIYYTFIFSMIVTAIYNGDFSSLLSAAGMLLIYIITVKLLSMCDNYIFDIYENNNLFFISHFMIFLMILPHPISYKSFEGPFRNPNSLGGNMACIATICLCEILNYIFSKSKKNIKLLIYGTFLFISIFFLLISTSRTSLITIIIEIIIFIIIILKNIMFSKQINKNAIKRILVFTILIIIIALFINNNTNINIDIIIDNITGKFDLKEEDALSGRSERWEDIIANRNLFGYGLHKYAEAPHNTYISILAQFGLFGMGSFIIFNLYILYHAIKRAFSKKFKTPNYFPLFCCVNFICLSMAEGMLLKTNMIMMYFYIPVLFEKNDRGNE